MKTARIIFLLSGLYGIGVLAPDYFTEKWLGEKIPPPITHPEFYYGFVGIALVFQLIFLVIASNPAKYRALMPVCILEKLCYMIPCAVLYLQGRMAPLMLFTAGGDLLWLILFIVAFYKTPAESPA
jgi:hypothetical protein